MIGTHIPLYLLAVVVIIVMCFDWWWWWCSVFTSHNHQSSMTPEKTQQATQWQVSLLASRTPPHSSPMQTWGKIRKWKIFFARRTRRSCHCSSLQSDPCHPGGNPQATWTCIGKLLNIFVWSIFGEVQNIFGAFQVYLEFWNEKGLTLPESHKPHRLELFLEQTKASSFHGFQTVSIWFQNYFLLWSK